jgi:hypothetical protein
MIADYIIAILTIASLLLVVRGRDLRTMLDTEKRLAAQRLDTINKLLRRNNDVIADNDALRAQFAEKPKRITRARKRSGL